MSKTHKFLAIMYQNNDGYSYLVLPLCLISGLGSSRIITMAERSKALTFLSWTSVVWVRIPLETYIFILNFSLPPRSEQVNRAVANEIKHVHSPEVIVVLDPRYDQSYKALFILCDILNIIPSSKNLFFLSFSPV